MKYPTMFLPNSCRRGGGERRSNILDYDSLKPAHGQRERRRAREERMGGAYRGRMIRRSEEPCVLGRRESDRGRE